MAIGPMVINGALPRVTDYATIKQNEDNKGIIQQANIHVEAKKEEESKARDVNRSEESANYMKRFDAKEKGSNEYTSDDSKKKKKPVAGGTVVKRQSTSSFDIRI